MSEGVNPKPPKRRCAEGGITLSFASRKWKGREEGETQKKTDVQGKGKRRQTGRPPRRARQTLTFIPNPDGLRQSKTYQLEAAHEKRDGNFTKRRKDKKWPGQGYSRGERNKLKNGKTRDAGWQRETRVNSSRDAVGGRKKRVGAGSTQEQAIETGRKHAAKETTPPTPARREKAKKDGGGYILGRALPVKE